MPLQRYVSSELSHFVGRSDPSDIQRQYDVLLRILRSGRLMADPMGRNTHQLIYARRLFPEEEGRYGINMVCFCDIPEPDLEIHVAKYGRCGLAISKQHAVSYGARPVFYIPDSSGWEMPPNAGSSANISQNLNELVVKLGSIESALYSAEEIADPQDPLHSEIRTVLGMLVESEMLMFVKGFDPLTTDEHPENYYMEREWRTFSDVLFDLSQIQRIFIPQSYAQRLRDDLPEYVNQVSFVD